METVTILLGLVVVLALIGLWFQQREIERLKSAVDEWARDCSVYEKLADKRRDEVDLWVKLHGSAVDDLRNLMAYAHVREIVQNINEGKARKVKK